MHLFSRATEDETPSSILPSQGIHTRLLPYSLLFDKTSHVHHHVRHFGAEADVASLNLIHIYTQSWFGLTPFPNLMLVFGGEILASHRTTHLDTLL
jgi:hypothetical protein